MDHKLSSRLAQDSDFDFAWRIYSEAVKPQITPHLSQGWVEKDQRSQFLVIWKPENTKIFMLDEIDIGWMSIEESEKRIVIENGYLLPKYRSQGIGTQVLKSFLAEWKDSGKEIYTSVLKNSKSQAFFERLSFKIIDQNQLSYEMKLGSD